MDIDPEKWKKWIESRIEDESDCGILAISPELYKEMKEEITMPKLKEDECEHCGLEVKPCPFCGKPGKVYGQNCVGCSDFQCSGQVDFGHWCGEDENGVPAEHFVIKQWNKRVLPLPKEILELAQQVEKMSEETTVEEWAKILTDSIFSKTSA